MTRIRSTLVMLAVSSAMLIPAVDVFARGGGRRGGGGGGGAPPPPQLKPNPALQDDQKQVSTAQADLEKAKTAYNSKLAELQKEYKKQPEYADVKKAYDDALKVQEDARTAVLAKLKNDDAPYKAAVAKEEATGKKVEQLRQATNVNRDQVSDAAKAKLDAAGAVEKLEKAALDADKPYTDAKQAVADAKKALDAADTKMADTLGADEAVKKLKQTVTDKQAAFDEAKKKYDNDKKTLPAMI